MTAFDLGVLSDVLHLLSEEDYSGGGQWDGGQTGSEENGKKAKVGVWTPQSSNVLNPSDKNHSE